MIYFGLGFIIALVMLILLYVVYILRIYRKKSTSSKIPLKDLINITSSDSELKEINNIITGKTNPKYKLIKGIEVIDLDDEETDSKGNSE